MSDKKQSILERAAELFAELETLETSDKIDTINDLRQMIHEHSPMKDHPVDCMLWIPLDTIQANDYNPNAVAPPEMKLLEKSIRGDGYTMPVVVWHKGGDEQEEGQKENEIVDGEHRSIIAQIPDIYQAMHGRLPVTFANNGKTGLADRMASTVRHNEARGTHSIEAMQRMVTALLDLDMSDKWIMDNLGMDADKLLRLKQLTGLKSLFRDVDFSRAWVASENEADLYSK